MNLNSFAELLKFLVIIAGARGLHEAGQPHNPEPKPLSTNPAVTSLKEPAAAPFSPQRYREWAKKAVRKYAQAQEKKWRNWEESMRK